MSSIHNIAFSSEKVIVSESGEKYAQVKHRLQAKIVKYVGGFWCDKREWTVSLEQALWIMA